MIAISHGRKALIVTISIVFLVLFLDQLIKILVKTHLTLGESVPVFGSWFLIRFIENPGMAFGIDIPGKFGKMSLTLVRIIAVIIISIYIRIVINRKAPLAFIIFLALILAGALGNIIDSMFYGLIFNESTYFETAVLFPKSGGYASFLHGQVVDMLYFPLLEGQYPDWLPIWGGQKFIFFRPIFNIADSSITTGVICIFFFQRKYLNQLR